MRTISLGGLGLGHLRDLAVGALPAGGGDGLVGPVARERAPAEPAGGGREARLPDADAFAELVGRLSSRLVRFLDRFLGDHARARDLTQEAFLRLHQRLLTLPPELAATDPTALLYTIAANLGRDELRRRKLRREKSFSGMVERSANGPRPDEAIERAEDGDHVRAALARLEPDKRLLLVLRDVDGLGYERIAEILAVPIGTVKSRISRARGFLPEKLQAYI